MSLIILTTLLIGPGSNPGSWVAFSCLFSLLQPGIISQTFLVFCDLGIFEVYSPVTGECPHLGLGLLFS